MSGLSPNNAALYASVTGSRLATVYHLEVVALDADTLDRILDAARNQGRSEADPRQPATPPAPTTAEFKIGDRVNLKSCEIEEKVGFVIGHATDGRVRVTWTGGGQRDIYPSELRHEPQPSEEATLPDFRSWLRAMDVPLLHLNEELFRSLLADYLYELRKRVTP